MAYLRFHFGGGGFTLFLRKLGYLHGVKRRAARGKSTRLLGGSGACSPEKIFKNCVTWCVLEYILLKFSQKIIVEIFIFNVKIIDIVLLRTLFRGIGAYSPDCLFIVQFGVFFGTLSENFLLRKYI